MSIKYLGLIISKGGIHMDPVKVAGVMDWPTLTKKKEVQSFLGFMKFYCWFIEGFLHHVKPLFEFTKQDCKWTWGEKEQYELKNHITLSGLPLILHFADDLKVFHIEVDSSDFTTGAVLLQQSSDNLKWHPIAFYLKSLNAVE
jgi:hypothetical protein